MFLNYVLTPVLFENKIFKQILIGGVVTSDFEFCLNVGLVEIITQGSGIVSHT